MSIDYAYMLYLEPNKRYKQNEIFRKLIRDQQLMPCSSCPYNPNSETRAKDDVMSPKCRCISDYMIIPQNRQTVNRILRKVPEQTIVYSRNGVHIWRAKYGYFAIRDKPTLVNQCWIGDHHVFDLFVVVTITEKGKKREILVRPTLTAWMDAASSCIVGWNISVLPNANTIADAFCSAAVVKTFEEFRGLPRSVVIDNGKDYRSTLLEDFPKELETPVDGYLNKRFVGHGLIKALDVRIIHAIPYRAQSKPIERIFGVIESKWISKLNGWCGNGIENRPPNFAKTLKKLHENEQLFTIESFTNYFASVILPGYHNCIEEEGAEPTVYTNDDKTPIERYHSMTKARETVPNWELLSALKMNRDERTVTTKGIRISNTFYRSSDLTPLIEMKVTVFYNDPLPPTSITVAYDGRYICEAFPDVHLPFVDAPEDMLQAHIDVQNHQKKAISSPIARIRKTTSILTDALSKKEQQRSIAYGPAIKEDTKSDSESISTPDDEIPYQLTTENEFNKAHLLLLGITC
ncbi:hypothetical protein AGMMS49992_31870 [Clostridia bacterium]|nr:hypothetical protein AGMMS49992_31870 [Clostridia bacterium]